MMRPSKLVPIMGLALTACVTVPSGPSVRVMPAPTKPFDVFVRDDVRCRGYASAQVGGTDANQAAASSGVTSAVVGTAVGAAAGALANGNQGAGYGAAAGLVVGSAAGTGAAGASSWELQRRYDIAYEQCMYAAGNQVPGFPAPAYYPPPRP